MRSSLRFSTIVLAFLVVLSATVFAQGVQDKAVAAEPGYVRFVTQQGDQNPMQTVTLYSNEAARFKVLAVTSPVNWITVKFRKAGAGERVEKGQAGNAQYLLDISLDLTVAAVGPIAERITVRTSSASMPEILIPVSGMIRRGGPPPQQSSNHTEARASGTVVDPAGAPLADVKVVITSQGAKFSDTKMSLKNGVFHFLILDATKPYKIHLEKPGYVSLDQDLQLKVDDTVQVTYTLKPNP